MRNVLLSTIFLLLTCSQVFSQKDPIKWGKIPAEDLAMTEYESDPDAGAVVLCDFGNINFNVNVGGPEYRFTRHKRIKVLNRSGFDQADVEVPYHTEQAFTAFKAQIFAPDGTAVKLSKKDLFDEDVISGWHRKRFTFPNVQEGSVIEYTYTISSGNLFTLREWYFQEYIPVRWNELRFSMLEWLNYTQMMRGDFTPVINESGSGNENMGGESVPTTTRRWAMENLPAQKRENFTACPDDYRSKIQFQLVGISIPGQYYETIEWPQIAGDLIKSEYFGLQYTKKTNSKRTAEAAAPLVAAAKTDLEKAIAIYDFVNENVKWEGVHWYKTYQSVDKYFKKEKGIVAN